MTTADRPVTIPEAPHAPGLKVAIVTAEWNADITHRLRDSARTTLLAAGVPESGIICLDVPGAVELTYAASRLIHAPQHPDAVIIIGCVVRGDTPHFDYVCQSVTQGMTTLNAEAIAPVVFCLLTVENYQQALDRCGGPAGDKGAEAGIVALKMTVPALR